MITDYHTHTFRCGHAVGTMREYIEAAMARGIDEIGLSDNLVVLHQGKVLAHGEVSRVIADAGAQDVNSAFMRLTGAASPGGGAAP